MAWVPKRMRPGAAKPPSPVKPDFTGKVHWPTNLDMSRADNVIESDKMFEPPPASAQPKASQYKLTAPIALNLAPAARPSVKIHAFPPKFRSAVRKHLGSTAKKASGKTRKAKKAHKAKKATRRHR